MAVTPSEYKRQFLASDDAISLRDELIAMIKSPLYATRDYYSPSQVKAITFDKKHLTYLSDHPKLDPQQYLANLRMMTKMRK